MSTDIRNWSAGGQFYVSPDTGSRSASRTSSPMGSSQVPQAACRLEKRPHTTHGVDCGISDSIDVEPAEHRPLSGPQGQDLARHERSRPFPDQIRPSPPRGCAPRSRPVRPQAGSRGPRAAGRRWRRVAPSSGERRAMNARRPTSPRLNETGDLASLRSHSSSAQMSVESPAVLTSVQTPLVSMVQTTRPT